MRARARQGRDVESFVADAEEQARGEAEAESDKRLLRALVDAAGLRDHEQDAFDDMLERLGRTGRPLSQKQREWALAAADRLDVEVLSAEDIAARDARVPRGRDVPTPDALGPAELRKALDARRARKGRIAG